MPKKKAVDLRTHSCDLQSVIEAALKERNSAKRAHNRVRKELEQAKEELQEKEGILERLQYAASKTANVHTFVCEVPYDNSQDPLEAFQAAVGKTIPEHAMFILSERIESTEESGEYVDDRIRVHYVLSSQREDVNGGGGLG